MKVYLSVLVGLLISITSLAQDAASQTKSFRADPVNHPLFPILAVSLLGTVVFILMIVVTVYMITVIRLLKVGISQASSEKKILATNQPRSRTVFQAYE